jgi:hypothetical protein
MQTRPLFPVIPYLVVPDILLATVLAGELSLTFRFGFYVIFAYICISGLSFSTLDQMSDYSMGSTLGGQFFTALHLLLLAQPISQYKHHSDVGEEPRGRPFWKKWFWSACVIHSPRGIGWNYQASTYCSSQICLPKLK